MLTVLTPAGRFYTFFYGGLHLSRTAFSTHANPRYSPSRIKSPSTIITSPGVPYPGLFKFSRIVTNSIFLSSIRCRTGPGGQERIAAFRLPGTVIPPPTACVSGEFQPKSDEHFCSKLHFCSMREFSESSKNSLLTGTIWGAAEIRRCGTFAGNAGLWPRVLGFPRSKTYKFFRRSLPYTAFPAKLRRADIGAFEHKKIVVLPHAAGILINGGTSIKDLLV